MKVQDSDEKVQQQIKRSCQYFPKTLIKTKELQFSNFFYQRDTANQKFLQNKKIIIKIKLFGKNFKAADIFYMIKKQYFIQQNQLKNNSQKILSMFENNASSEKATQMFYSMQYEQGLKLIDQCIAKDPKNSILFSNRALFYSQLDYMKEALQDLNYAIELNYLNYIAYFNMFSLLMRCQKFDEAFQNLCCSLSCLYLIRAKTKKSELDASKSIKYAQNNMQAHILKGLIHLQNGKYKLALNQLDWACQINPANEVVRNIRNLIFKKMNPGLPVEQNQIQNRSFDQENKFTRLYSSYTFEESDSQKELRDKILEFNEIYNNLNQYQGTITTKVPKQNEQLNAPIDQTDENIFESNDKNPQQYDNLQKQDQIVKQQLQQSTTNIQSAGKIQHQNINQLQNFQLQNRQQDTTLSNEIQCQNVNFIRQERELSQFKQSSQAFVADDGAATPSKASMAPQPGQYGSLSQNSQIADSFKIFHSINNKEVQTESDKFSDFESMIHSHTEEEGHKNLEQNFESFISENHNEIQSEEISIISNSLYPKPQNFMLQFSILKLQILNKTRQEISQMKNLYCIANYLNVKEENSKSNFKLRTACQKGQSTGTQWNETFDPIQIPNTPECMKIKVYNKKYSSYRDDLIGQMEVQITTHGLVKLPLFNKKGDLSGSLFMNIQLVHAPILETDEAEQIAI